MERYLKKHKLLLVSLIIELVLLNIVNSGNSYINVAMTDSVMKQNIVAFLMYLAISFGLMLIVIAITYMKNILVAKYKKIIATELRSDYLDLYISDFKFESSDEGIAISKLTNDVNFCIEKGIDVRFECWNAVISVLVSLVMASLIHWSFLIIFPISSVISFLIMNRVTPTIQKTAESQSQENASFVSYCSDVFTGFSVLYSYHVLKDFKSGIENSSTKLEEKKYQYNKKSSLAYSFIMLASILSQFAYIIDAGALIAWGITSPGTIVGLMSLAGIFYSNMQTAMQMISSIRSSKPIIDKMLPIDNADIEIDNLKSVKEISICDLSFSYEDRTEPVIKSKTYNFITGNKYLIKGKSGCGKSTLLKLISGRLIPSSGIVQYDSQDISEINQVALTNIYAYVDQNVHIFDGTIKYNITLGRDVPEAEYKEAIKIADLSEYISLKEEKDNFELKPDKSNISGGQAQRIAIARAICSGRKIFFMDEALSGCDILTARKVEKSLIGMNETTLFMVSHRNDVEYEKMYDEVINV